MRTGTFFKRPKIWLKVLVAYTDQNP